MQTLVGSHKGGQVCQQASAEGESRGYHREEVS